MLRPEEVVRAAADRFIDIGLELGGKDPSYVRKDANLPFAIENLVDGAYFNSGQSCCGKERLYVHADVFDDFVEGFVDLTKKYKLGSPLDPTRRSAPWSERRRQPSCAARSSRQNAQARGR